MHEKPLIYRAKVGKKAEEGLVERMNSSNFCNCLYVNDYKPGINVNFGLQISCSEQINSKV